MISTRVHAVTDYLLPLGIAALAASGRFGGPVRRIMQAGPAWHLGYTLLTRYEGGLLPLLGMRTHLACDAAGSLSFLGAGVLLRSQKPSHRLSLAYATTKGAIANFTAGLAGMLAELAGAYVLLASDEASYITGAIIPVTGGKPML